MLDEWPERWLNIDLSALGDAVLSADLNVQFRNVRCAVHTREVVLMASQTVIKRNTWVWQCEIWTSGCLCQHTNQTNALGRLVGSPAGHKPVAEETLFFIFWHRGDNLSYLISTLESNPEQRQACFNGILLCLWSTKTTTGLNTQYNKYT